MSSYHSPNYKPLSFILMVPVAVSLSLLLLSDTIHTDVLFEKTSGLLSATEDEGWREVLLVG